jgi:hypothetical protein
MPTPRIVRFAALTATLVPGLALSAQANAKATTTVKSAVPPAMAVIRRTELERDLYAMAGDGMRGREAGTPDEMRASMWVAEQLRTIGVKPMGQDGSYFQWFNMVRTRVSTVSTTGSIGNQSQAVWKDFIPLGSANADVSAPVVWVGDGSDSTINVRGKFAAVQITTPAASAIRTTTNSKEVRYANAAIAAATQRLQRRGAVGLILVADSTTDVAFDGLAVLRERGTYDVDGGAPRFAGQATQAARPQTARAAPTPSFLVRGSMAAALKSGPMAELQVRVEHFTTPSTNIVGVIRGTDPRLRDEYVLYSSHQDHDGVRYVIDGDSVWAGADDNGTVSVALLAIARAFVKQPGKRSVLFVYHGAEERGLLGSRYHAAHPVVPLRNIVAVLNGDMIGRNHPDSASLLGIQPPHRNSSELVDMALRANTLTGAFKLDSIWDRPTHPEGWYFRSDHVPYARLNVPAVMYSTNLHPDYHTPRDKPTAIDYPKLTRMTQWMYLTGWYVATTNKRPAIDPGFKLER